MNAFETKTVADLVTENIKTAHIFKNTELIFAAVEALVFKKLLKKLKLIMPILRKICLM